MAATRSDRTPPSRIGCSTSTVEGSIPYVHVGGYLLALEIIALGLPEETLRPLRMLLGELGDPTSRAVDDVLAVRGGGMGAFRDEVTARYVAMEKGIGD